MTTVDHKGRPTRRTLLGGALAGAGGLLAPALRARAATPFRLGVLGDMSGPLRDVSGEGTVVLARQAAADFAAAGGRGFPVEVIQADHQHKPDVGIGIARRWFDTGEADAILEVNNSAIALGVADLAAAKDKVFLATGAATSELTGAHCNANTIHWTYDTWMLGNCTGTAVTRAGGDTWYFILPNYTFGQTLTRDTMAAVQRAGGKVLGSTAYPFPSTTDFSSQLLTAQASGAKVIGLAGSGADSQNFLKQAREFGIQATLVPMQALLTDLRSVGEAARGIFVSEPFYWDFDGRTRGLTRRVLPRMPNGFYPSTTQVGAYSAALHCLKAVAAMGGPDTARKSGAALVAAMKAMPTDDDALGRGRIREDGRKIHDVHLFKVRDPKVVRNGWDLYDRVTTIPAEEAFRPLSEGGCKLVRA